MSQFTTMSVPKSLKKDSKKHGKYQYHCMDDICILVRVDSSSIYSELDKDKRDTQSEDLSLEAYAKRVRDSANHVASSSDSASSSEDFELNEKHVEESNEKEIISSNEVQCTEFLDPVSFAKELVKNIVSESEVKAEQTVDPLLETESLEPVNMERFESSEGFDFVETKRSFSEWPTIENFSVEEGAYKIDEYLASFDTEEDWMYVIYYQGHQETHCSDLHKYQAIYSLPTWRYPIAQATASMYFTIEICKVKPSYCQVDITYQYEGFSQVRKPGVLDFQEKWLHYILDSKINIFRSVTF